MKSQSSNGYLAFPGYLEDLKAELALAGLKARKTHGDLILAPGPMITPVWARNIWKSTQQLRFKSVADAVRKLNDLGPRWALYPHPYRRNAELIVQGLQKIENPPLRFLKDSVPNEPLGSFTMVSPAELLVSRHCSQTLPNGDLLFQENKAVPTRAYLKLWEAFTRLGRMPSKGDRCFDLGSSPGGWTWVLAELGAHVVSVDRSELDPTIQSRKGVEFLQGNAFALEPSRFEKVDWVFSDVICEPPKILELVQRWLECHPHANFICSVKFKGTSDFKTMDSLLKIRGSSLIHLTHNKHEVTWIKVSS